MSSIHAVKPGRRNAEERGEHPFDLFMGYVDQRGPSDCWPWLGGKSSGYGMFRVDPLTQTSAHRYSYAIFVGAVPGGMDLDHQCHSAAVMVDECIGGHSCPHRSCVNPRHLEPVTRKTNMQRGYRPSRRTDLVCVNGHERTEQNTYTSPNGATNCRDCNRDAKTRWYDKRRKKPRTSA